MTDAGGGTSPTVSICEDHAQFHAILRVRLTRTDYLMKIPFPTERGHSLPLQKMKITLLAVDHGTKLLPSGQPPMAARGGRFFLLLLELHLDEDVTHWKDKVRWYELRIHSD